MTTGAAFARPDTAILVTAYLGSPSTPDTALRDAGERYRSTLDAIRRTREAGVAGRIFVALCGNPSEAARLAQEVGDATVSCQWFAQDPSDQARGKGWLEHLLIRSAIAYWRLDESTNYLLKLTGKYVVENLCDVVAIARDRALPVTGWRHLGMNWIDTRCFMFRADAYVAAACLDAIDERASIYVEQAVYTWVRTAAGKPLLFVGRPIITGLSGSTDVRFRTSLWKRALIRAATFFSAHWTNR